MEFSHVTVLLAEAVDALNVREDGIYVDGTCGGAGHSRRIAQALRTGRLIALDKDPDAIAVIRERLAGCRADIVREDFRNIPRVLSDLGIQAADGILLDLGVSSHQLDTPQRGFSYQSDARLDMRMSGQGVSACDLVNTCAAEELSRILWEYGEERYARRIAQNIVRAREKAPVETTAQLAGIVRDSIPAPARREGGNPCKRTFQALRIAVNEELDALSECLDKAFECLRPAGRFAVITFHSLEDRLVKQKFKALCQGCICPPEYPVCVCGHKPRARAVTRKPITPGERELLENRRSHSARLRVIERISGG